MKSLPQAMVLIAVANSKVSWPWGGEGGGVSGKRTVSALTGGSQASKGWFPWWEKVQGQSWAPMGGGSLEPRRLSGAVVLAQEPS